MTKDQAGSDVAGEAVGGRGLLDGFEGYLIPTRPEVESALQHGLVALDANVLLNIYRYTSTAREDLLKIIEKLGDRVWIPHQVAEEFWRNRESVLRDPRDTKKTLDELTAQQRESERTLRTWANRVSADEATTVELLQTLDSAFASVAAHVSNAGGDPDSEPSTLWAQDSSRDVILSRLLATLTGHVGSDFATAELRKAAVGEGLRRVNAKEPPGYLDGKDKKGDGPAGDYLVWRQLLNKVKATTGDVVFVTNDKKDDWWRSENGQPRGPRIELVDEFRREAPGARLFMLRPTQLLDRAKDALDVDVQETSVAEVERIETASDDSWTLGGGWSEEALAALLDRLDVESPVRASVLRLAMEQAGFVSREQVYEIGEYNDERSLRGFTRPINRIAEQLVGEGLLPNPPQELLKAIYGDSAPGVAVGFRVLHGAMPLLHKTLGAQLTWLEAADLVIQGSDRAWHVREILEQITAFGLKDVTRAATPEATLRRDLASSRASDRFEQVGPATFRRRPRRTDPDRPVPV